MKIYTMAIVAVFLSGCDYVKPYTDKVSEVVKPYTDKLTPYLPEIKPPRDDYPAN